VTSAMIQMQPLRALIETLPTDQRASGSRPRTCCIQRSTRLTISGLKSMKSNPEVGMPSRPPHSSIGRVLATSGTCAERARGAFSGPASKELCGVAAAMTSPGTSQPVARPPRTSNSRSAALCRHAVVQTGAPALVRPSPKISRSNDTISTKEETWKPKSH